MATVDQTKRVITQSDIHLVYDLFMDQVAVAPETIEKRVGADPAKFLQLLFGQPRFRRNVVDRLNAGAATLGGAKQRSVRGEEIAQLADMLGLTALPDLFGDGPIPRDDFFRRLLTWPSFLELFSEEMRASLRLKQAGRAAPDRKIVGEIDGCFGVEVTGWAYNTVDPAEKLVIEFVANGVLIGSALCDGRRRDVAPDSATGPDIGFSFTLPLDVELAVKASDFWLVVRDSVSKQPIATPLAVRLSAVASQSALQTLHRKLAALSAEIDSLARLVPRVAREASYRLEHYRDYHEAWLCISPAERASIRQRAATLRSRPLMSIVVDCVGVDRADILASARSTAEQIYDRWELVAVVADPSGFDLSDQLALAPAIADRVHAIASGDGGAAARLRLGLDSANGDYRCALRAGDRLAPDALFQFAAAVQEGNVSFCYADADVIEGEGSAATHVQPLFKPGLDRDLILQDDYIGLFLIHAQLLSRLGETTADVDAAATYDVLLGALAVVDDEAVRHVPRIISHHLRSTRAEMVTSAAVEARQRVVRAYLDETSPDSFVVPAGQDGAQAGALRVVRPLPDEPPAVTIVIPTRDRVDLLRPCLESIVASRSAYAGFVQIIVVDNGSVEGDTAQYLAELQDHSVAEVLSYPHPFNWAQMNNLAAQAATGEMLIFLNNDVVVSSFTWIAELVREALRPEVGAVGAKLLFQNGAVQHAGVLGGIGGIAVHDGLGCRAGDEGYLDRNARTHGAIAVTGACLCIRASLFEAFGGFDAEAFAVAFNDLDLCLRLREAGYRVLYTPHATLFHFESQSRGIDDTVAKQEANRRERAAFTAKWGKLTFADPFYNANFDRASLPFSTIRPVGG